MIAALVRVDAAWAREVVLFLLVMEALAASGHAGPPHAAMRPGPPPRVPSRRHIRRSVTGRRPRG